MYRFKTEDIQLRCFIFSKQSHRVQAIYRIPSSIATLTGNVCSFLQKLEDLSNNTPKHFLSFWPRKRSAEIQPHSGPSHRITDQKETHFKEWLPQSRAVPNLWTSDILTKYHIVGCINVYGYNLYMYNIHQIPIRCVFLLWFCVISPAFMMFSHSILIPLYIQYSTPIIQFHVFMHNYAYM